MALFDLPPKESPRNLFGREVQLNELVRLVDEGRWVALLGPRMVGKTSLLKAANHRIHRSGIYVNLWGARGSVGLLNAVLHGMRSSQGLLGRMRQSLRRVEGISVGPGGVSVSAPRRPLRTVWDLLGVIGAEAGRSVIEFDEVQEIAEISGTLLRVLGNVFNTYPDMVFVFTGSYFGLLRSLLDPRGDSPLMGRPPARLDLFPFDEATSVAFLNRGFAEYHLSHDESELRELVRQYLDGVPGWLTLYGNSVAVQRLSKAQALRTTLAEGKKVVRSELSHFLETRNRSLHWAALRILLFGASWSELRNALTERRGSPVNDNTIRSLLRALQGAGMVSGGEGRYVLSDPMLRAYLTDARAPPR